MAAEPAAPAELDPLAVKARNRRNIWLGLALFAFVVLMGVGTAIRISQGAGTKPCEALYWEPTKKECMDTPVLGPIPSENTANGEPG